MKKIVGVSLGSSKRDHEVDVEMFGEKYNIPVVADVSIGHTTPLITMPIGVNIRIDSNKKELIILESATI